MSVGCKVNDLPFGAHTCLYSCNLLPSGPDLDTHHSLMKSDNKPTQ